MNKRTFLGRMFIFFVGLPLVIFIAWLPYFNHLGLHLLILSFVFLGANELYSMLSKKTPMPPRAFMVSLTVLIPLVAAIHSVVPAFVTYTYRWPIGQEIITFAFIFTFLLVLSYEIFTAKEFETSNTRIAYSVFMILYAGYLITFVSRMTVYTMNGKSIATAYLASFLLMVFLCDSIAWFFGVLLGKNNKGFIAASPNKSIMGFIGGFVGSIGAAILSWFIWPEIFHGSILKMIVLGAVMAFSSILGDLAESIFKRSSDVKDSGHIIPGRGGALDCLDSIVMSAPVFYILTYLFYHPELF